MKTKDSIQKLLLDFYSNKDNMMLVDYYTSRSFFDVIQKGRSETVHSAFLAWLLEGKDFPNQGSNSPIMHFLQTLLRRKTQYKSSSFDDRLADAVSSGALTLSNIKAVTEKPVSDFYQDADNKDRLDIYITCEANIASINERGVSRSLNIIIENKVDSAENLPKNYKIVEKEFSDEQARYNKIEKKVDNYDDLYQTDRYYYACESTNKSHINLYVYLSAISKKDLDSNDLERGKELCWCEHFIPICYQDVLDYIIEPQLCMPNMSEKNISLLNEYVKCLSIPAASVDEEGKIISNDKQTIMAVTNEERKKVGSFIKDKKNNELLNVLISLYSAKNYYTVGGSGLYPFDKALKSVFKDWKEELKIRKKNNGYNYPIISRETKYRNYIELESGLFLNVDCETDYAIMDINNRLTEDFHIEKISVEEDARFLLEPFWEKNQALFLSALHVLSEKQSDEKLENLYAVIYDQLSSRDNTKFSINGEGIYSKIDIVQKFVERIWDSYNEPDEIKKVEYINDFINSVSKGPHGEGILLTSDNWCDKNDVERQNKGNKKVLATERYKIIKLDKKEYYLSTQWGGKYYSASSKNENFPNLLKKIKDFNDKYPNNQMIVKPI